MTETTITREETQIRKFMDNWVEAVRAKDSKLLESGIAPGAILFDLIEPLQYRGSDALQRRAEQWFSSFQGPIDYEVRDLHIATSEGVAFCHSLNHVHGANTEGKIVDMWWRATVCFEKTNGKWTVTHEHNSVPFDMKSGKASMGLRP